MKKIFLVVILLFSIITFAQRSEYNKNVNFGKSKTMGIWFTYEGTETLMSEQSTVGYFKSYNEINKVLKFYSLDFDKPFKDETLLDSNATIDDYKEMSFDLLLKNAVINKIWIAEKETITWYCENNFNTIVIMPKEKLQPKP